MTVAPVATTSLTAAQQALVKGVVDETKVAAPVVLDISVKVDNQPVTTFGGNLLTIRVPFTVPEGAKGEDFDVYYLSADGKTVHKMPTKFVADADGTTCLEFVTDHLSDYVALNGEPEGAVDYKPGENAGGSGTGTGAGSGSSGSGASKPGKPAPNTGDNANVFGMSLLMLLSGMLAVALLVFKKKAHT